MKAVLRILAVLFAAIGAFLVYAVINAVSSANGAKVGVSVGYIAGALLLGFLAFWMWKRGDKRSTAV